MARLNRWPWATTIGEAASQGMEIEDIEGLTDIAREQAIRAAVAAQWAVMVTIADWCAAFAVDPVDDANEFRFAGFGRPGVIFGNLAALPTPEQIVDGVAP